MVWPGGNISASPTKQESLAGNAGTSRLIITGWALTALTTKHLFAGKNTVAKGWCITVKAN
jgi:hypothetical protein